MQQKFSASTILMIFSASLAPIIFLPKNFLSLSTRSSLSIFPSLFAFKIKKNRKCCLCHFDKPAEMKNCVSARLVFFLDMSLSYSKQLEQALQSGCGCI
ncbi:unnamed protein product [Blepharisma stoltei]|uniref:Uncharacterized protein n=1 Tax=Blepharisma stoltei TaxID=1481888 RepID=A0AAU9IJJ6_9CILI|nr:unnamed protein product [Blepharisma stoltei]